MKSCLLAKGGGEVIMSLKNKKKWNINALEMKSFLLAKEKNERARLESCKKKNEIARLELCLWQG